MTGRHEFSRSWPRPWSWVYGLCAAAVLGALAFVSSVALRLEGEMVERARRSQEQDRVAAALWRLDSLVLPLLAREGARPYFEYLAYYPQERGYTRLLSPLEKGEVLVPSPLLRQLPEYVQLHFQIDGEGRFTSPQAPEGNQRDLAEATCVGLEVVPQTSATLARAQQLVPLAAVRDVVTRAEAAEQSASGRWLAPHPLPAVRASPQDEESTARLKNAYKLKQVARNDAEWANRSLEVADAVTAEEVHVGALVPIWLGETPELFFFRRVVVGSSELLQGVFLDWNGLAAALTAELAAILPGARLVPLRELGANYAPGSVNALATIPVELVAPAIAVDAAHGLTAGRVTLLLAWGATLVALAGGFWLLRSSLALGERSSRFASAVTHELRTPLTTFRMYSEMLADGMVPEPAAQRDYLATLKEQSARLAALVENVLTYARVEEGRGGSRREPTCAAELVARHRPALEQRAAQAGLELSVTVAADVAAVPLATDGALVGQIVGNLVDNACKYAASGSPRRIEWNLARDGRHLVMEVRDHGPGIAARDGRRIFEPFDRGSRDGDPAPGVGLGLALARGLARDLGGELTLVPPRASGTGGASGAEGTGGASFRLRLPLAR